MRRPPSFRHPGRNRSTRATRVSAFTLALLGLVVGTTMLLPFILQQQHTAEAAFTLPPAPWGEFTPFYGAAPCIPDFQDVGVFSPSEAKADAMVDKLSKK